MMPPTLDPRAAARKKRAVTAAFIAAIAASVDTALDGSRFHSWAWVSWIAGLAVIIGVAMPAFRDRFGGRSDGRSGGGSGAGRSSAGDSPATHRWHTLVIVSRLMPRSSGNRWLAEAESTLSEITDARRGPALRSYLLSAPRLIPTLWAQEIARLRRRRAG